MNHLFVLISCFPLVKALWEMPNVECTCDGTQYIFRHSPLTKHPCVRLSMCSFDMAYYFTHMPQVKIPPGYPTVAEYEARYKSLMGEFGYPLYPSVEGLFGECRRVLHECFDQKRLLVRNECERFRPLYKSTEWSLPLQEKGPWKGHKYFTKDTPYNYRPGEDLYFNWWRMYIDGRDLSRPMKRFKYVPLDKRYFWPACPYWIIRPTFTMAALLTQFSGAPFHENMSIHVLVHYLVPWVVRAMHCAVLGRKYVDMYMHYNKTEFCKDWHATGTYVCINLDKDPIDKMQRDVIQECRLPTPPPKNDQWKDYSDQDNENGIVVNDNLWFYPDYPDYPETKWSPDHLSFPWFPPYQEHPENDE